VLSVIDRRWREHLYEMDYLKDGIGLRAMAQRDPLVEYQREGFQLWQAMNESVKAQSNVAVKDLLRAESVANNRVAAQSPDAVTGPNDKLPLSFNHRPALFPWGQWGLVLGKPHLGTDRLVRILTAFRQGLALPHASRH